MKTQILDKIQAARHIALISHKNPDGDAIGSLFAMRYLLQGLGKEATVLVDVPIGRVFHFLHDMDQAQLFEEAEPEKYDLLIYMDAAIWSRAGDVPQALKALDTINIDHHEAEDRSFPWQAVDTEATSTTQIIGHLFREEIGALESHFQKKVVSYLYFGLLTDCGGFSFSNTTPQALRDAADFVELGADPVTLYNGAYRNKTLLEIKLLTRALSSLRSFFDGKMVMMHLTQQDIQEMGVDLKNAKDFIDYIAAVPGAELAVFLREEKEGLIRGSLRSMGHLNVEQLAGKLGGGGHIKAAGFTTEGTLASIESRLQEEVLIHFEK